jgi:hypothetical protein
LFCFEVSKLQDVTTEGKNLVCLVAEGGPMKHADPAKRVNIDKAVLKCNKQQL